MHCPRSVALATANAAEERRWNVNRAARDDGVWEGLLLRRRPRTWPKPPPMGNRGERVEMCLADAQCVSSE